LRILVVDDEPAIRRFPAHEPHGAGLSDHRSGDGKSGARSHAPQSADVLVLDLGLPDRDGFEVIQELRGAGSALPIIVLSSRADEAGKVRALDLGADDYVTKPFGVDELLARVRARIAHIACSSRASGRSFACGDLAVDLVRRIVTVATQEVKLTPREYDLLRLLVAMPARC
jgi:two-component system KDP operon response regulator KdpE